MTSYNGGDVYLASTRTQSDQDIWLIESGASYHMTPHREWFCKYECYDGGDVFLWDESTTKIFDSRKSSNATIGWEEKNPSRCATHSWFGNKLDIC